MAERNSDVEAALELGLRIRALRRASRLSQGTLGRAVGLQGVRAISTIAAIESGLSCPTPELLRAIEEALGAPSELTAAAR
jgi:transcriptional regulator with XRE-family HTH domain